MSPPDDRAAVLRRRALFVGSALAALGSCQRGAPPAGTARGPVIAVGEPDAAGEPEPDAAPLPRGDTRHPTREGMPSLEIPSGLGEVARQRYEDLVSRMTRAHGLLDEVEASAPSCGSEECAEKWTELARKLYELENVFGLAWGACRGSSVEARAFEARRQEHVEFFENRKKEVETWLLGRLGQQGFARLRELVENERLAHPRPCLSIACADW